VVHPNSAPTRRAVHASTASRSALDDADDLKAAPAAENLVAAPASALYKLPSQWDNAEDLVRRDTACCRIQYTS
jgi:hypothetical protein